MSNPMSGKPNDFIVRLDGLPLDEAARHRIAGAIQSAVLAELGKLDLAGNKPTNALFHIPTEWLGLWLREVTGLREGLGELKKTLGVTER
jgi:hypothetical protein